MVKYAIAKGIEFDKSGFLKDFRKWDFDVAELIAYQEGVDYLDTKHWRLIFYLRDYFNKNEDTPMIRTICRDTGLCLKDIYKLFPTGPVKGLCRIAGLPRPTNCL